MIQQGKTAWFTRQQNDSTRQNCKVHSTAEWSNKAKLQGSLDSRMIQQGKTAKFTRQQNGSRSPNFNAMPTYMKLINWLNWTGFICERGRDDTCSDFKDDEAYTRGDADEKKSHIDEPYACEQHLISKLHNITSRCIHSLLKNVQAITIIRSER